MGVFPKDRIKAETLILQGGLTARLGGATKVITKTYHEAHGIPDPEVNAEGIRMTRMAFRDRFSSLTVDYSIVEEELAWIIRETTELVEPVLSDGHLIPSIVKSFEVGSLDIPFPANPIAKGMVIPVRDQFGAVRIADHGQLTFSKDVIDRNRRLSNRARLGVLHEHVKNSIMHFEE